MTSYAASVVECPRNPGVETALRCSRCEEPICPKCMIHTPVGARCRPCARIAKSPVYTLTARGYASAGVASLAGGIAMGLIWIFVLFPFSGGFLSIFLGAGLGYAFTRGLDFATGRKRGPGVIAFAFTGIGLAWAMQFLFVPELGIDWALRLVVIQFREVLYGLVAVGVAAYFAYQQLR